MQNEGVVSCLSFFWKKGGAASSPNGFWDVGRVIIMDMSKTPRAARINVVPFVSKLRDDDEIRARVARRALSAVENVLCQGTNEKSQDWRIRQQRDRGYAALEINQESKTGLGSAPCQV